MIARGLKVYTHFTSRPSLMSQKIICPVQSVFEGGGGVLNMGSGPQDILRDDFCVKSVPFILTIMGTVAALLVMKKLMPDIPCIPLNYEHDWNIHLASRGQTSLANNS